MPPRQKPTPSPYVMNCEDIGAERFYGASDGGMFKSSNWWDMFCAPYGAFLRLCEFCSSLFSGVNKFIIYWMMIQWALCKISRLTSPDPVTFPYYFYLFSQMALLFGLFGLLWMWLGQSLIIPYFRAFYRAFIVEEVSTVSRPTWKPRAHLKKFCFKKGEIFDSMSVENGCTCLYAELNIVLILSFSLILIKYYSNNTTVA